MPDDTVRVWLVAREYEHEDVVTLVYATPDGVPASEASGGSGDEHGESAGVRAIFQQRSTRMLFDSPITAAQDVDPDRLEAVDPEDRQRYADEAERMVETHDPDDEV